MKRLAKLSIAKKISLSIILILCVTLSTYLTIFFIKNDNRVYSSLEAENLQLNSLLIESIRFAMAAGADDTEVFEESLQKFEKIDQIRITPTNRIEEGNEGALDELEKLSLISKRDSSIYETFNEKEVLRSVSLLKADA